MLVHRLIDEIHAALFLLRHRRLLFVVATIEAEEPEEPRRYGPFEEAPAMLVRLFR